MELDSMTPPSGDGSRKRFSQTLLIILINLFSLACLVWVVRGADIHLLRHEIAHLDWRWVSFAMVTGVLAYLWQAWRWVLILAPVKRVSFFHSLRAIYVGLFASGVFPLHAGELIRCFLQARWNDIPLSVTLASASIERIFDGAWLMACLFLAIHLVPHMPGYIVDGGYFLGFILLVCVGFLAVAMYWKQQTLDALLRARWLNWVHVLIQDLHLIGHSRYLYFAFFASLPYMLMQTLPIYAMLQAYRPLSNLSLLVAFTMMVVIRLGSVVPQAPGNLGAFNAFAVISLMLFHVPEALAKRFSIVLLSAVTLPLLLVGFFALAITGLKMHELRRQAKRTRSGPPQPQPAAHSRDI